MGTLGYLLDTHTFLWAVRGSAKLSHTAARTIESMDSQVFVSAVSAYEIMNKYRIGKLPEFEDVAKNYFDFLERLDVTPLPINTRHAHYAGEFEREHRDPFDRLLAAQAFTENLTIITNDPAFDTLPWIHVLW
jgi:PIN domain nuclease of toxin-antitoxin system